MPQPAELPDKTAVGRPEIMLYGLNTKEAAIFLVDSSPFVLGKDTKLCQGVISFSDEISKTHAAILYEPSGRYVLRDLGSSNGTYLNGAPLQPGQDYILASGDRIGFSTCIFGVEDVADETAATL